MTSEAADRTLNFAWMFGGVTAAVIGGILLLKPDEGIGLLMILLGIWWLVYGAFMLFSVFIDKTGWGWQVFLGALGLSAGFITLQRPLDAAAALGGGLAVVLGALALIIGIAAIFGSFQGGGMGALLFGVVSAAIGVIFIFNPIGTARTTVMVLAWIMLVSGIVGIFQAVKYK
jgi:uncharacterized membrane protein HdeD (DUF308 family)